ncbi:Adaptor protein complex AP-3 delta subunit [Cylindrobasidium torrendii FP15055 ss-10]|uniref:AP-3 complex subunit delta n=1 Tax=Cylindrobasidium torrendii FP15055 ss-10 TaxID=1314674 RepID=A0A0D7BQU9_9AGAR|nr:Adaptor protein complex AP-3 delta subunit [Cylindrobasidium torrendii FP15055 ss-10]
MWERTLQDLIRGLRSNKSDESKFISKAVDEIRREIRSDDMELKAGAVLKLTYLDMLGYDMSWASFNVVEVMSSSKFHLKSVGYLAATQSFNDDTDVLMLTTNLLKKDLTSNPNDVALTLNGISHIVTSDLGRDLAPELLKLMNHSRPPVRKRAVAALYKTMMKYPDVVPQGVSRLQERLQDSDISVVAATVNVICELARRNPADYLPLAPALFHLMTTSANNWMLIKIIKLFGSLTPHEPRLVKKLQPPITELISTTSAISLLYECVHTCIIGGMLKGDALAQACVTKLAGFIEDTDQNLKYIALHAMAKIVPTHPHLVAEYQDTILASVSDQDISIRMRALELVTAMVNRHNLQSIVQQVLSHLVSEDATPTPSAIQSLAQHLVPTGTARTAIPQSQSQAYRLVLSQRILTMCSQDMYDNITNFEWYLSVLVDLAHVAKVNIGAQIRDQLVDVVGRVRAARRYAVRLMSTLICDESVVRDAAEEGSGAEVLWAAGWICGEYCDELIDPQKLIPKLLDSNIAQLAPETTAVCISSALKIFGFWATQVAQNWTDDDLEEVKKVANAMVLRLGEFIHSQHIEIQERAAEARQLFNFINADLNSYTRHSSENPFAESGTSSPEIIYPKCLYLVQPLFDTYSLNPVNAQAQASVPLPDGLNLDVWFIAPPEPVGEPSKVKKSKKGKGKEPNGGVKGKKKIRQRDGVLLEEDVLSPREHETVEDLAAREQARLDRLARQREDPYYIMDTRSAKAQEDDIDSISVVRLEGIPFMPEPLEPPIPTLQDVTEVSAAPFIVERDGEMPVGTTASSIPASTSKALLSQSPSFSLPSSRSGTPITSFPAYDVPDSDERPSTPAPIKVSRAKKKAGKVKKRKTKEEEAEPQ